MRLVIVLFPELINVAESWIVAFKGLEESFDLALRGRFFNATEYVLYSMAFAGGCESAWAVVAPVLCVIDCHRFSFWSSSASIREYDRCGCQNRLRDSR